MSFRMNRGAACAVLAITLLASTAISGCSSLNRVAAASALVGSGRLVTQEYQISGFDSISASSSFTVEVRQADSFSVKVTIDDNAVETLDVVKEGDTLRLSTKAGAYTNVTRRAEVTMPKLAGVRLSGASTAQLSDFGTQSYLGIDLSGASRLTGTISAKDTRIELSGASNASLAGNTERLDVHNSGASRAELADYRTHNADIRLGGASRATIEADGRLDADLSGASSLVYGGSPTLGRTNTSGGATLRHR